MKKSLLFFLVFLFFTFSCDSPTSSSKPYETLNGEWKIFAEGDCTVCSITAGEDFCYFLNRKYDGHWVLKTFNGSHVMTDEGVRYDLNIKLRLINNDSIQGNWLAKCIIKNTAYYDNFDFTGVRN